MRTVSQIAREPDVVSDRLRVIALGHTHSVSRAVAKALATTPGMQVVYDDLPISTDREANLLPFYHIALADIDAGQTSTRALLSLLTSAYPNRPVVGITHTTLLEPIWHAFNAGASGVIHQRDFDPYRFRQNIVTGSRANAYLSPTVARILLDQVKTHTLNEHAAQAGRVERDHTTSEIKELNRASLSPRECEILKLSACGHIGKEIANILSVSPHTVTTHFKNIYRKLEVTTRGEAVFRAHRAGLI